MKKIFTVAIVIATMFSSVYAINKNRVVGLAQFCCFKSGTAQSFTDVVDEEEAESNTRASTQTTTNTTGQNTIRAITLTSTLTSADFE